MTPGTLRTKLSSSQLKLVASVLIVVTVRVLRQSVVLVSAVLVGWWSCRDGGAGRGLGAGGRRGGAAVRPWWASVTRSAAGDPGLEAGEHAADVGGAARTPLGRRGQAARRAAWRPRWQRADGGPAGPGHGDPRRRWGCRTRGGSARSGPPRRAWSAAAARRRRSTARRTATAPPGGAGDRGGPRPGGSAAPRPPARGGTRGCPWAVPSTGVGPVGTPVAATRPTREGPVLWAGTGGLAGPRPGVADRRGRVGRVGAASRRSSQARAVPQVRGRRPWPRTGCAGRDGGRRLPREGC